MIFIIVNIFCGDKHVKRKPQSPTSGYAITKEIQL